MLVFNLLKRLVLAALLAVYAYGLAEICVRIIQPQPLLPRYTTAAPYGVRQHVPLASYQHVTGDGVFDYKISSQGLRADRDYTLQPEAGTCRIGMFGASYFMGYEVNQDQTMAAHLETILREGGTKVEVINFALAGFGTGEMLRKYEGLGRRFNLDVVLFEWAADDLDDNVRSNLYDVVDGRAVVSKRDYLPAVAIQDFLASFRLYRFLTEKSHFYSFIREWAGAKGKVLVAGYRQFAEGLKTSSAPQSAGGSVAESTAPAKAIDPKKLSADIVRHAQAVVQSDGKRFMLVEIPRREGRTEFSSTLADLPEGTLQQVRTVPMLHVLDAAKGPEVVLFREKGHYHYTELGNQLAAGEMARQVRADGALARCTTPR
jgi:hypothetical protein